MTKPFNIHDWQAKQRQQRLTEAGMDTPGGNPDFFYDKDSIIGKSKEDPDYIKKLNAKNAKKDVSENIDTNTERKINNFIKSLANLNAYSLQDAVNVIMRVLRSQNYDGVNEHHEGGPLADKLEGMSANELMDFIKSQSELRYDELEGMLEDWWDLDENITGGGATFSDGNSMGHFGDATKKKIK
jgi:hypothetical protein